MEDWAEIRRLHKAEGMGIKAIARHLGIARNTVRSALTADVPPKYTRPECPSMFEAYEQRVRSILEDVPTMPASVLSQRVGWTGSASHFRARVSVIKAQNAVVDPADRLFYDPGEMLQCDLWFPPTVIPLGYGQSSTKMPVLAMTSGFSRMIWAMMIPSKTTADLLAGMWMLLAMIGGVPRKLVWDNETGIGKGKLTEPARSFAGTLATRIIQLPPRDPESKGIVERTNGFMETSFMPGRSFTGIENFNAQLGAWLPLANAREHRRIGGKPSGLHAEDIAAMIALPPVAPTFEFADRTRLARDYYVRVLSNDYSVDPAMIGRLVDIRADLGRVQVFHEGRMVADHARVHARRQTVIDLAHVATAKKLRTAFQERQRMLARSRVDEPEHVVVQRYLGDYDELFDVSFDAVLPGGIAVGDGESGVAMLDGRAS